MRIALLDPPAWTPPYDASLAAALARRGHEVELLTSPFAHGDVPEPEGYRRNELFLPLTARLVRRAPRSRLRLVAKGLEYLPSVRRLARRLEALSPDVVHVQWLAAARYDVRWLRPLLARSPLVFTAHDVLPRLPQNLPAWREIVATFDRVVVHSGGAVDQLAGLGAPRERIACIRHPIFEQAGPEPQPPAGRTLLFFGLLREYKGVDLLLRAFARVPDARLVVAGDPVDSVEPLRRLAADLGVDVEWRLGFLPDAEVAELMRRAAAVVLPYRRIDSSGVLATALGHGRPVVVTDVGSLGEIVREFGAGLVVPPEDVGALAEACTALLADPEPAFRGTAAARAALTWDVAAAEHERVYEAAIGERG